MALALLMVASLAACGGSSNAPVRTPAQQLAAAKAQVDAATSMHLTLRSSGIPASVNGALGADGSGTHAPAFKGTLDARISGFEAKVDVVAIDKLLYVKLPFTTQFAQAATTHPVEGAKTRVGPDVLKTITGTLPGATVAKLLNIGDATKTFNVTYGITDPGGELRTVTMTGPFYKGATSTYTLTLDKYGASVEISKP